MSDAKLHFGVVGAESVAHLSGREMLEGIVAGRFPQPPICQGLAFRLVEVGEGFAAFEGDPGPQLLNPMGGVHGGWALTLIDSATGCAAHSLLAPGVAYTTIETKGNFSRPITPTTGRVRAEGRVISSGRTIISAEATLRSTDGRVLAHGTATMLVLTPRS